VRSALLLALVALLLVSAHAANAQSKEPVTHAPSGDSLLMTTSITVPPIPNAPFTATVSTVWERKLEDGTIVTIQNRRTIARDASGRVFQERRTFRPVGDAQEPELRQTEYADPAAHVVNICRLATRTCSQTNYFMSTTVPPPPPAGSFEEGKEFLTRVGLGTDTVAGLEAVGSREKTTIAPGTFGNDRTLDVVKEFWYSPQRGINLVEKRQDPRAGTQKFEVQNLSLGEPDGKLFEPPADFRTIDLRKQSQRPEGTSSN
jgi:hypothetical protein